VSRGGRHGATSRKTRDVSRHSLGSSPGREGRQPRRARRVCILQPWELVRASSSSSSPREPVGLDCASATVHPSAHSRLEEAVVVAPELVALVRDVAAAGQVQRPPSAAGHRPLARAVVVHPAVAAAEKDAEDHVGHSPVACRAVERARARDSRRPLEDAPREGETHGCVRVRGRGRGRSGRVEWGREEE